MATTSRPVCSRCDAAVDKGALFESVPRVPDHRLCPRNQGVVWAVGPGSDTRVRRHLAGSRKQRNQADQGCHDPDDAHCSRGVRTRTPLVAYRCCRAGCCRGASRSGGLTSRRSTTSLSCTFQVAPRQESTSHDLQSGGW
jgi:hypothetical protein